jgi:prevent-host-death family protein
MARQRVGIREIRQNLSVYLERVKHGEALEITEHGHPVAILQPLPRIEGALQRLIAEGRVYPPTRPRGELPPLLIPPPGAPTSEQVLEELRAERL